MMIIRTLCILLSALLISFSAFSEQVFCPGRNGFISIGMTPDQVINACGTPRVKRISNVPVMERVDVQQLIYNNQGTDTAFFGYWNMNVSNSATGNGGGKLQINIIGDKVDAIILNGTSDNATSVCNNRNIQVGDPASLAFMVCGTPSIVNRTFIMKPIKSRTEPVIWIYQEADYLPSMSLIFVDGRLQSIN